MALETTPRFYRIVAGKQIKQLQLTDKGKGKKTKKQVLSAKEHIVPEGINTHHYQEKRQGYILLQSVAIVPKNSIKNEETNDIINNSDNIPDPKRC